MSSPIPVDTLVEEAPLAPVLFTVVAIVVTRTFTAVGTDKAHVEAADDEDDPQLLIKSQFSLCVPILRSVM